MVILTFKCTFCVLFERGVDICQFRPPDASQMVPPQMTPKWLPNDSQMPPRCLPDASLLNDYWSSLIINNHPKLVFVEHNDDYWWPMMITDDQWWSLMSNDDDWWSMMITDVQWWWLMINDDHWWSMMITDGQWWSLMMNDDYWWSVMITDGQWWSLMMNDDHCWSLMINDDYWWSMMITDDQWWLLMVIDDSWWSNMISPQRSFLYDSSSSDSSNWFTKKLCLGSRAGIILYIIHIHTVPSCANGAGSWRHLNFTWDCQIIWGVYITVLTNFKTQIGANNLT
jgi:hypothetical protein